MKRKPVFLVLLSFLSLFCIALSIFLVFPSGTEYLTFNNRKASAECTSHSGYHYDAVTATTISTGHLEHWACCTCHGVYTSEQTGSWTDVGSTTTPALSPFFNSSVVTYRLNFDQQEGTGGTSYLTNCISGNDMPSITVPTMVGYSFGGYYTSTGGSGTQYYNSSGASVHSFDLANNTTLYAKWTINTYSVTFIRNENDYGMLSSYSITVPYNTTYTTSSNVISFSNGTSVTATPTSATAQYSYNFSSWSSTSGTITDNTNIMANFERSVNNYTVSFSIRSGSNYGSLSKTSVSVPYGTTYSVSNNILTFSSSTSVTATPKAATAQYTYSFGSWSSTSGTITGATEITCSFTQTVNNYTVTISSNNTGYGTVSTSSVTVPYGTTFSTSSNVLTFSNSTSVTATPKAATAQYTYSFGSWSSTSGTIIESSSITANFARSTNQYTVTFMNGDTVYDSQTVDYNSTVTQPSNPSRTISGGTATFIGWYIDADCTTAFSFSTKITGNTTLYAGFKFVYSWDNSSSLGSDWTSAGIGRDNASTDSHIGEVSGATQQLSEGFNIQAASNNSSNDTVIYTTRTITGTSKYLEVTVRDFVRSGETYGYLHVSVNGTTVRSQELLSVNDYAGIYCWDSNYLTFHYDLSAYVDSSSTAKIVIRNHAATNLVVKSAGFVDTNSFVPLTSSAVHYHFFNDSRTELNAWKNDGGTLSGSEGGYNGNYNRYQVLTEGIDLKFAGFYKTFTFTSTYHFIAVYVRNFGTDRESHLYLRVGLKDYPLKSLSVAVNSDKNPDQTGAKFIATSTPLGNNTSSYYNRVMPVYIFEAGSSYNSHGNTTSDTGCCVTCISFGSTYPSDHAHLVE